MGGDSSPSSDLIDLSLDSAANRRSGVRVCDFSDDDDDDNRIPFVEVGYVNASGLTHRSVWGESFQLSELFHQPVTAIPNAGGMACNLLARGLGVAGCFPISAHHPTVQALLRAWDRFFSRVSDGRFLQIYYGDGGLFVERALQLISCPLQRARIRVVGINPSFFVTVSDNRHFYTSPGSCGRILDMSGYLSARRDGCVSHVPFSPHSQSITPGVGDACFELGLRMEFIRLAGLSSLSAASSPTSEDSDSSRLQLVRVVSSEDSVAFARLYAALNEDMTSSVRAANPFPFSYVRLILLLTTLCRHTLTTTKAAYSYTPVSWEALDMLDSGFTASYVGGVMELSCGYGVTIQLLLQNDPRQSCLRNLFFWMESTLTPVILLDIAERHWPALWDRVLGLGMRITTPSVYREERARVSESNSQAVELFGDDRRDRYRSRQHAAVGTSVELVSVVCGALVQLMFLGIDGFSLRLPEICREVPCNNTSTPNSTVIANSTTPSLNNTSTCSGNSTTRPVLPSITGIYETDVQTTGVARTLNVIRMIWCGVMLLYFLYTAFRLVRNARRRN
ncbi:DUF687 domain-containing protein [Chlamydia trachomatis]|uniref:Uncharacterized protein n=1 Tax=Chlamydia trachomatis serovar D (strain ATCC VR-885 / DSM 19411 / UW-3/Cx) TaxID=272561 RepID=O84328_CHLTR|nr:DUF687 family protein [Chlamydia trachomatis]NP_219831.1 hypothetical protein CT_326 [Chlamydia trachomatis D/UW-3/CX]AAC67919.1 hypothetical protein CT_326 [Chlamydia trachomatis D/UW-3/CX]ADI51001.1 Hypothetical protein CTDEC_0326 [Chlamydia trachomatis D-EC]ADI52013.1 Hypothetical protein CTDLC_0326 [Chlamydia trachomatis D-LC]AKR32480.1 hypothetical protein DCS63711_01750 [Chlamydia trachomatis D/CS637/11]UFT28422.1 DUF687 domain-containing protein [Chlamydia trachomatis]